MCDINHLEIKAIFILLMGLQLIPLFMSHKNVSLRVCSVTFSVLSKLNYGGSQRTNVKSPIVPLFMNMTL